MEEAQAAPVPLSSRGHSPTSTKGPAPVETRSWRLVLLEHHGAPLRTRRTGCQTEDYPGQLPASRAKLDRGSVQSYVRTARRPQVPKCRVRSTGRLSSKCQCVKKPRLLPPESF